MIFNYCLIFILSVISSFNVNASTFSIEKGLFTRHSRNRRRFNEDNELIGIEIVNNGLTLNASSFINSFGVKTKSIGTAFIVTEGSHFKVDVIAGILDGYTQKQIKTCKGDYCGYIAPRLTLKYDYKGVGVKATAMTLGDVLVITSGVYVNF